MSKINNPTNNLFWRKGWRWFLNIKDMPIFLRRVVFAAKHGYAETANWETFAWFIEVMREILTVYRHKRMGTSIVINDYTATPEMETANEETYNAILDKMLSSLNLMDENNPIYDDMDFQKKNIQMNAAKDDFFRLFSKYFYTFWD